MATSTTSITATIKVFIEKWWTHGVAAAAAITAVAQTDLTHLYSGLIVAGSLALATFVKYLKTKI